MEVHHHSHTARKKWTHYFWEFIMLFLAVFCGFLAEYQLEHKIEKEREKQYMQTMVEDLQKDTANLHLGIERFFNNEKQVDALFNAWPEMLKGIYPVFYNNSDPLYGYKSFIYTDRTIQQLKSSGGMRLIKKKKATEGIMEYDAFARDLQLDIAYLERFLENFIYLRGEILDMQAMIQDIRTISPEQIVQSGKTYLLTTDPKMLAKLRNRLHDLQLMYAFVKDREMRLKKTAEELIITLRKEYHLK